MTDKIATHITHDEVPKSVKVMGCGCKRAAKCIIRSEKRMKFGADYISCAYGIVHITPNYLQITRNITECQ